MDKELLSFSNSASGSLSLSWLNSVCVSAGLTGPKGQEVGHLEKVGAEKFRGSPVAQRAKREILHSILANGPYRALSGGGNKPRVNSGLNLFGPLATEPPKIFEAPTFSKSPNCRPRRGERVQPGVL
jgi:hypothetical protein